MRGGEARSVRRPAAQRGASTGGSNATTSFAGHAARSPQRAPRRSPLARDSAPPTAPPGAERGAGARRGEGIGPPPESPYRKPVDLERCGQHREPRPRNSRPLAWEPRSTGRCPDLFGAMHPQVRFARRRPRPVETRGPPGVPWSATQCSVWIAVLVRYAESTIPRPVHSSPCRPNEPPALRKTVSVIGKCRPG